MFFLRSNNFNIHYFFSLMLIFILWLPPSSLADNSVWPSDISSLLCLKLIVMVSSPLTSKVVETPYKFNDPESHSENPSYSWLFVPRLSERITGMLFPVKRGGSSNLPEQDERNQQRSISDNSEADTDAESNSLAIGNVPDYNQVDSTSRANTDVRNIRRMRLLNQDRSEDSNSELSASEVYSSSATSSRFYTPTYDTTTNTSVQDEQDSNSDHRTSVSTHVGQTSVESARNQGQPLTRQQVREVLDQFVSRDSNRNRNRTNSLLAFLNNLYPLYTYNEDDCTNGHPTDRNFAIYFRTLRDLARRGLGQFNIPLREGTDTKSRRIVCTRCLSDIGGFNEVQSDEDLRTHNCNYHEMVNGILASYRNIPEFDEIFSRQTREQFAAAGFVFCGGQILDCMTSICLQCIADAMLCLECTTVIYGWGKKGTPFKEHCIASPSCPFVQQMVSNFGTTFAVEIYPTELILRDVFIPTYSPIINSGFQDEQESGWVVTASLTFHAGNVFERPSSTQGHELNQTRQQMREVLSHYLRNYSPFSEDNINRLVIFFLDKIYGPYNFNHRSNRNPTIHNFTDCGKFIKALSERGLGEFSRSCHNFLYQMLRYRQLSEPQIAVSQSSDQTTRGWSIISIRFLSNRRPRDMGAVDEIISHVILRTPNQPVVGAVSNSHLTLSYLPTLTSDLSTLTCSTTTSSGFQNDQKFDSDDRARVVTHTGQAPVVSSRNQGQPPTRQQTSEVLRCLQPFVTINSHSHSNTNDAFPQMESPITRALLILLNIKYGTNNENNDTNEDLAARNSTSYYRTLQDLARRGLGEFRITLSETSHTEGCMIICTRCLRNMGDFDEATRNNYLRTHRCNFEAMAKGILAASLRVIPGIDDLFVRENQTMQQFASANFVFCDSQILEGAADAMICLSCMTVISAWNHRGTPFAEHLDISPNCPFISNLIIERFGYEDEATSPDSSNENVNNTYLDESLDQRTIVPISDETSSLEPCTLIPVMHDAILPNPAFFSVPSSLVPSSDEALPSAPDTRAQLQNLEYALEEQTLTLIRELGWTDNMIIEVIEKLLSKNEQKDGNQKKFSANDLLNYQDI